LRFPEFTEEWETKKLGEVATNKSEKYNPANETDFIKCIEMEHLTTDTGQLLGYIDGSTSGSIKNVFNEGDVLFGKLRPYLKKYLQAPFDGVCSSEIWVLKGKNISNDFLYRIVQTKLFIDLANQSSGSKMPRADWNVVESGSFSIPTPLEQKKISSFLALLDERIQTQNKIIEQLETLIKGLSEKIFSQKIRFKEFTDEWKVKSLGEMGNTFNGLSGKTKEDFGKGIPYIQYKQIFDSAKVQIKKCGLVEIAQNENQNSVKYGDIFFTISSETPDEIGMSSVLLDEVNEMYLNSFCFGYRPFSLQVLNPLFASYLFRSSVFRNEIVKLAQGSTRYNMSKIGLMKLTISLPSSKEQITIARFLSSIDQKLQTEKNILDKYQSKKQFLLQNLFI